MYSSTLRLFTAGIMAVTIAACSDGTATLQTVVGPTPIPAEAPGPRPIFALSGIVSEMTANGVAPVEGVTIAVASCVVPLRECAFDKRVTTDAQGSYIVDGMYPGPAGVWLDGTGFRLPDGVMVDGEGVLTVMIVGDTRFDIQLVRR